MSELNEFIQEFVVECREGLDQLDNDLVALEASPHDADRLDNAFRTLHTIKGNAGFLDFTLLGELAHAGETLLGVLRDGKTPMSTEAADALLELLDAIRSIVDRIETTGAEGPGEFEVLTARLAGLAQTRNAAPKQPPQASADNPADQQPPPDRKSSTDHVATGATISLAALDGNGESEDFEFDDSDFADTVAPPANGDDREPSAQDPDEPHDEPPSTRDAQRRRGGSAASSVVRVDVDLLDDLMNLVGELVLTRNQIMRLMEPRSDSELLNPAQRLNALTTSLQEGVMKTRMQQIGSIWQRYPRMVRDLARQCNKNVALRMDGEETELDKSLVEAISDPLLHLVRNAIDHGIEKPYLRRVKGKPEQGLVRLHAYHEGGQVHIDVSDDGAGIDLERVKQRAVQRGLITAEEAQALNDSELRDSIFLPGFSTADKITRISGRGVGMDVVKTGIEQIGGTLEIDSTKDVGTTFRLTVPLTLAIIPAVLVRACGQRFAVPQINVVELLTIDATKAEAAIERFHDTPVLRLRGELLPVVPLSDALKMKDADRDQAGPLHVMVLRTGTRLYALIVDEIGDSEEIVVKPVGELLSGLREYTGAALMGDGGIALILDPLGVARRAGLFRSDKTLVRAAAHAAMDAAAAVDVQRSLLVTQCGSRRQVALPLERVVRIEEIDAAEIESAADQEVIQYRGEIVPLIRLPLLLSGSDDQPEIWKTVIYDHHGQIVALAVTRIVDIADRPAQIKPSGEAGAIQGTAVVLNRVTDMLDIPTLIDQTGVRFFETV